MMLNIVLNNNLLRNNNHGRTGLLVAVPHRIHPSRIVPERWGLNVEVYLIVILQEDVASDVTSIPIGTIFKMQKRANQRISTK